MATLPNWLMTLQRVREQHRDTAWQSLAQCVRVAAEARTATAEVVEDLVHLRATQRRSGLAGPVDTERLRQIRGDRDQRLSILTETQRRQSEAETGLQQAQSVAAVKEADVEILRRLSDRLLMNKRCEQQRRQERSAIEVSLSLCNEQLGG